MIRARSWAPCLAVALSLRLPAACAADSLVQPPGLVAAAASAPAPGPAPAAAQGPTCPGARLWPAHPSFGSGLVATYLLGATLGVLDVAGLHRLDHPIAQDNSGIWSIARTPNFPAELIGLTLAGAVWEGGRSRFGRTLWQSIDAAAMAGISTQALKWTFQRMRPSTTTNPDRWFQGVHNASFPSGDVSSITALVTPLILEYHRRDPMVDTLAVLPAFDMAARMKAHGHWLTDTMAGAAVGVASGYFAHSMRSPFILGLLPGGFYVGLHERFE